MPTISTSLSMADGKRMSGLVSEAKMMFFGLRFSASRVETMPKRG
ncbi:hypothetical protein OG594_45300 [Streptomyces sp. NBC_01214]|nr:hypothetical protein [Streptomyces sp. NBC_01214]MCX4808704.1 hypothetical protein [Streptomyces sp. NBC_01214]